MHPSFSISHPLRVIVCGVLLTGVCLTGATAADPAGTAEIPTASKDVLVLKESHSTKALEASGRDVTINGSDNTVAITGECHALTISGKHNTVSIAAVASISLAGAGNHVKWKKAVGGAKPQITDQGKGNTVSND